MDDMPWNDGSVTGLACDFAKRLLHKDPAQRMTAAQAQAHPWLTAKQSAVQETPLPADIFRRLENFTRQNRLKCLLMTVVRGRVVSIMAQTSCFYTLPPPEATCAAHHHEGTHWQGHSTLAPYMLQV